jgi:hypothetical protein
MSVFKYLVVMGHVFLQIVEVLGNHGDYFQQKLDATGRMSLSPLQKCTTAIRM